jgi:hypothetical protein
MGLSNRLGVSVLLWLAAARFALPALRCNGKYLEEGRILLCHCWWQWKGYLKQFNGLG